MAIGGADHEVVSRLTLDGKPDGLVAAMARSEAAVREQTGLITTHLTTMSTAANRAIGLVGTGAAILAGGKMFKDFISESQAAVGETLKLAKVLGTSTQVAGAYRLGLHSVNVEQEVLEATSTKLSAKIATNEEVFKRLHIQVRDTRTGALLPMTEIILNTVDKLNGMEAGANRNAAASLLFGRSWKDNMGILKLNRELIEESRRELHELGLEVGPERVAQFTEYRKEMKYTGLVMEAMKVQVGNALLPVFISLGKWMHEAGPTALFVFAGALKGVVTFVEYASLGVATLWETWKALWGQFSVTSIALVRVITQIISGDFSGAWQTAKQGMADFGQYGEQWFDNIAKAADRTNARVGKLWGLVTQPPPKPENKGDKGQFDTTDPDESRKKQMGLEDARLKAILEGLKMREQAVRENARTLVAEEDFYYQTGLEGQQEYLAAKNDAERKALFNTLDLIDQEISAISATEQAKLGLAKDQTEKDKISEEAKKERTAKLAEKQKLNAEIYQLDLDYFTKTVVLEQNRQAELRNAQAVWSQTRRNAEQEDLLKTGEFYGMVAEMQGDNLQSTLVRIEREKEEWIRSWVMMTDSFEVEAARRAKVEAYYARKTADATRDNERSKLDVTARGFASMASLADSFYQISGRKNKEAFRVYQMVKSGETVISTASTAMKAFDDGAKTSYWLGLAQAAAAIAFGGVQLASIWSASPEGGGGSVSAGMGGAGGGYSGGSPSDRMVTQPIGQQASAAPTFYLVLNNPIGEKKWFEDNVPEMFRDFASRNVNTGVVYKQ